MESTEHEVEDKQVFVEEILLKIWPMLEMQLMKRSVANHGKLHVAMVREVIVQELERFFDDASQSPGAGMYWPTALLFLRKQRKERMRATRNKKT